MTKATRFTLLFLFLAGLTAAETLLPPYAKRVNVSSTTALVNAISAATPGTVILLADGVYNIANVAPLRIRKDSVAIYGVSQDPAKVILKGGGFTGPNPDEELIKIEAKATTLAYFTLRDGRANGVKVQTGGNDNLLIHAVNFIDICERSIKAPDMPISRWGEVRYCLFDQVTAINAATPGIKDGGNYTAGIDAMKIEGWNIHDNTFRNIRGATGGARAGIFLWNGCKRVTVANNRFIGCDRGIALGNTLNTAVGMDSGAVRDNIILAGKDISLEICNSMGDTLERNQVIGPAAYFRAISLSNNAAHAFRGNTISGRVLLLSGQPLDTAGNVWITDAGITGAIPPPTIPKPLPPLPPVVIACTTWCAPKGL